jgi:sirohydrochlorin ferrochelatase
MNEPEHNLPNCRALLVIAHGSPRAIANADLYRLLDVCRNRHLFDIVQEAFLECNEPSIPAAIDLCAAFGASEVVAVPFFLHTGKHVAEDLPTLLESGRRRHPRITFRMGEYIGNSPFITSILVKRLNEAVSSLHNEVG